MEPVNWENRTLFHGDNLKFLRGMHSESVDLIAINPPFNKGRDFHVQLDHNTPRADGGINHISNRVLLCGPCNQVKSNIYTLSGRRRQNKEEGWMGK